MSSDNVAKTAIKIIKRNPEYFEALVDFEKTGKLPKFTYKQRINFTIDETLLREFRIYCEKNNIKMSNKIEELIRKELFRKNPRIKKTFIL
mgnify:CR=1 FL=1